MKTKKFLNVKKTLAKLMVLVMVATTVSVSGLATEQSVVSVSAAEQWNSTTIYYGGDEVEHNGSIYRAQWWTQGNEPGTDSVWILVSDNSSSGSSGSSGTGTTGGTIEGTDSTETLNPKVGTNIQGITLPANYYNKKVVGYFPNYAIGKEAHKDFDIADLQWDKLTHVQYAFGVVNTETFKLEAGDVENDIENKFEDREFVHKDEVIEMDDSLGYYGQFNIMHTLKEKYPDVTVLISTGGWAASEGLWYCTQDEEKMKIFSESAVEFIRKYGFDGIDIDFEFPSETAQSGNYTDFTESIRAGISDRYVKFIKILSEELAEASREDGKYYWLTSAVSASSWVLGGQTNSDFLDYLDFVSIMSYDYHGGWNNYVENQANLYPDPLDGETIQMAVKTLGFEWSYRFYRGKVQSEKILMGVPYYTRGWSNVSGGTNGLHGTSGTPLTNATDNLNLWYDLDTNDAETPAGANPLWHVMNVMKQNSNYQRYWDDVGKVPYIWNSQNSTFLTFEDTQSVQERINYVNDNNLGGVLIWVMHGDYDYDATKDEYVVGDTLTSMFHDQFAATGASQVTSDIDYTNKVLDFDVDFSGTYDHPNYTYSIKVTNNTGVSIPSGYTFSFYLPRSSSFTSSWGGNATTREVDNSFTEVTFTSTSSLEAGATQEFTGMMKCCFSAAKNFKINGLSMMDEVNGEIQRLNRSYITEANGGASEQETTTEASTEAPTEEVTKEPETEEVTTEESTEEVMTEEPTTSLIEENAEIMINGYQISTTAEGFRTVYTVDDPESEVVSVGMIYGLADYVSADEMVVDSTNDKVFDYAGTEIGKFNRSYIDAATSTSYTMTMKFVKSAEFYSSDMYVRAYAKMNDGSYIYSDVESLSVYDVSDYLYQNRNMNTYSSHSYLYNNILSLVTPDYLEVDYDWGGILVK